jgi:hypothetical protein
MEEQVNIFNDDNLIRLIKEEFNDSDNQLFQMSFQLYNSSYNKPNDYIIDLDDIYKWIGFSRKDHAKTLLITQFKEGIHYKISLPRARERLSDRILKGGENKEKILLNIKCFKKYCLKASTEKSDKIYDYYIKMEEIIFKYIQEQYNNQQIINIQNLKALEDKEQLLQIKDKELEYALNQLEIKDNLINNLNNQTYEEIKKDKFIYIFSTDKPNIYKIGRSKDPIKRRTQLQTANVDDIIIIDNYPTSDDVLLEQIIHNVLNNYRCKSDREHFFCNLNYIKLVINIAGSFLDTLKSTYEHITKNELLDKINQKINIDIQNINIIQENNNHIQENNNHIQENNNYLETNNNYIETNNNNIQENNNNLEINNNSIINNIQFLLLFLKEIIINNNNKDIFIIQSSKLFLLFNDFLKDNNFKIIYTATKFGIDIKKYDGIEKHKALHGYDIYINIEILKKFLINKYKIEFL